MAITINYKNLFLSAVKYMSKEALISLRDDILKRAGELADLTMTTVPQMKELDNLVKQAQLISMYIRAYDCHMCDLSNLKICVDCCDGITIEK